MGGLWRVRVGEQQSIKMIVVPQLIISRRYFPPQHTPKSNNVSSDYHLANLKHQRRNLTLILRKLLATSKYCTDTSTEQRYYNKGSSLTWSWYPSLHEQFAVAPYRKLSPSTCELLGNSGEPQDTLLHLGGLLDQWPSSVHMADVRPSAMKPSSHAHVTSSSTLYTEQQNKKFAWLLTEIIIRDKSQLVSSLCTSLIMTEFSYKK